MAIEFVLVRWLTQHSLLYTVKCMHGVCPLHKMHFCQALVRIESLFCVILSIVCFLAQSHLVSSHLISFHLLSSHLISSRLVSVAHQPSPPSPYLLLYSILAPSSPSVIFSKLLSSPSRYLLLWLASCLLIRVLIFFFFGPKRNQTKPNQTERNGTKRNGQAARAPPTPPPPRRRRGGTRATPPALP